MTSPFAWHKPTRWRGAVPRHQLARSPRRFEARLLPKVMEMALSIITMLVGGACSIFTPGPQAFLDLVKKVAPKLTALPSVPEQSPAYLLGSSRIATAPEPKHDARIAPMG
jgi:hypothetical protein